MGDTVKITFSDSWTQITGLTTGITYALQNVQSIEAFIQQVPAQPGAGERGKVLLPFKSARIIKEESPVWIRSKSGGGTAFYNALP